MTISNKPDTFTWAAFLKAIWFFLKGYRLRYVVLIISLLITFSFTFIPPYLLGEIIDFFATYQNGDSLTLVWWYLAIIGVGSACIAVLRLSIKNWLAKVATYSTYAVKVLGFERLMSFSVSWHDKENTGNKISRIERGYQAVENFHNNMRHDASSYFVYMFGAIFAFAILAPKFVIFLIIYLIIFFLIQWAFYKKMVQITDEYHANKEQAAGSYYEGVGNLTTIKTLGVKTSFKETIDVREQNTREKRYAMHWWGATKWKVFQVFDALATMVFLYLVIQDVLVGVISFGSILVFYTYLDRLAEGAKHSTILFDNLVEQKNSIERMMPIFRDTEVAYDGDQDVPEKWDSIVMKHASFSYKQGDENEEHDFDLRDINFEINKHEKIGIVGKSGSGKSTLAKIMLGLYKLDKGEFKIGDMSFYDIDHNKLTEHMTTVMQDSEMFNMTLQENITLMRQNDPALLDRAIRVSKLDEVIDKLPEGLQTLIGEKGYRLSGGERQRVGIARAIYKDPEILVLDEATSSLDNKTETVIQEGLEQELTAKTMIIIAHRISTLKNVDTIYVFDQGRIVEQGTFDELSKNKDSKFYEIYTTQSKNS